MAASGIMGCSSHIKTVMQSEEQSLIGFLDFK